jgi:hypothetical protein
MEVYFYLRLTFKSALSIIWVGHIQSVEHFNRKTLTSLEGKGILPANGLCSQNATLPGSPACQPTLQILDMSSLLSYWSQYLKINTSLCIYTSCCFCFSGEPFLMPGVSSLPQKVAKVEYNDPSPYLTFCKVYLL